MGRFAPLSSIRTLSRSEFEERCIAHCNHIRVGERSVLCRVLTNYKMFVDIHDEGIAPHLLMDGYWESWISQLMARIIQPGMTCLDIGANFGYFSLLMSGLAEGSGRTIAVEPNPHLLKFLRATKAINGSPFELVEAALSDDTGEAILTVNEHEYGGGTIKPNELLPGKTQVKVPTISVDQLLEDKGIKRVDVIKMDVESVEPLVFAGMKKTIQANPQLQVVMEYTPANYEDAEGFTRLLFNHFEVNQIRDFDDLVKMNESSVQDLLKINGHIDLYLGPKNQMHKLK